MSKVFLHQAGRPDKLLGHVKNDGSIIRSEPGFDDEIGHVDVSSGKIYAKRLGLDDYLGRVDMDDGRIYRHVPAGSDEYLGKVLKDGAMYRHVPKASDDYIGKLQDSPSFAHAGAAFMMLVLPAVDDQPKIAPE